MSPKERILQSAQTKAGRLVRESRERSDRERAYLRGRRDATLEIVAWLRSEAEETEGMGPVDRAVCIRMVADEIERAEEEAQRR